MHSIYIGALYSVTGGVYERAGGACDREDGCRPSCGDGGRAPVLSPGGRSHLLWSRTSSNLRLPSRTQQQHGYPDGTYSVWAMDWNRKEV